MDNLSLALTFSLVLVAIAISYQERLRLEKDLLVGSVRAVLQLTAIGFILTYVFDVSNPWLTTLILLLMIYNATTVAAKRGAGIAKAKTISYLAMLAALTVTLGGLVAFHALQYQPSQVIPVSGMIVGNAMVALGIAFRQLKDGFRQRRDEVEAKLCLGATPKEAARSLVQDSIRAAMQPTVDSMKTVGLVQLPGMMTGLILAGSSPLLAIKYQIMVTFMLSGAVALASFLACFGAYRSFFNQAEQLITPVD